jgi:hypothetical protein
MVRKRRFIAAFITLLFISKNMFILLKGAYTKTVADEPLWDEKFTQKPLHTMYPFWTQISAFIVLFGILLPLVVGLGYVIVTFRDAIGLPSGPMPHAAILIWLLGPILAAVIYVPIRNRLSMFGYISWLKTFDEPRKDSNSRDHTSS